MDFYKPTYMLELEPNGSITDGKAAFRMYKNQLWNYSKTIMEKADKKQMQADWCRINKGALNAGFSALGREEKAVQRLLVNKLPKRALGVARIHFVYVNNGPSRFFCIWQFINDTKMQEAEEMPVAVSPSGPKAEAAEAEAEAGAPLCFCAASISQIEARLNALETCNAYSMQLGVMLGLVNASEAASANEPPAVAAEPEPEPEPEAAESATATATATAVESVVTDANICEMMTEDNDITDLLNDGQTGMIIVFKNLRKQLQYGILTTPSAGGTVYNYRPLKRVLNSLKFEYYDDPNFKHPNTNNQIGAGRKIYHLQNASLC